MIIYKDIKNPPMVSFNCFFTQGILSDTQTKEAIITYLYEQMKTTDTAVVLIPRFSLKVLTINLKELLVT